MGEGKNIRLYETLYNPVTLSKSVGQELQSLPQLSIYFNNLIDDISINQAIICRKSYLPAFLFGKQCEVHITWGGGVLVDIGGAPVEDAVQGDLLGGLEHHHSRYTLLTISIAQSDHGDVINVGIGEELLLYFRGIDQVAVHLDGPDVQLPYNAVAARVVLDDVAGGDPAVVAWNRLNTTLLP